MSEMTESIKYVFLDVVKFTKRSVEAQSDVIKELNKIVMESVQQQGLQTEDIIFIPTGDGICLAIRRAALFDIHMLIALDLLSRIKKYNDEQPNEMRKFGVRIGINENVDNIVNDINGRVNVAGSGINYCSRIMDQADEGQILLGQPVYDILKDREKYMVSFRSYEATIKHNIKIPIHQYIEKNIIGLNTNEPKNFSAKSVTYSLSKLSAYYFAHAIKNKDILIAETKAEASDNIPVVLLWYLAEDSVEMSKCKTFDSPVIKQLGGGKCSIEEQYDMLSSSKYFWIVDDLCGMRINTHLKYYHSDSFEEDNYGGKCWFVINDYGKRKLKKEHPDIWEEFALDKMQ